MQGCENAGNYRLRTNNTPQLVCATDSENCECAAGERYTFVIQTFGAEVVPSKVWQAKDELPESGDFIGMSQDAELQSANYNGTQFITLEGNLFWQGQEQGLTEYYSEDELFGEIEMFEG